MTLVGALWLVRWLGGIFGGGTVDGRPSGFTLDTDLVPGDDYEVASTFDNAGWFGTVNDTHDTFPYGYLTNSNLIDTITASAVAGFERKTSYEANRDVITQHRNDVGSTPAIIGQYDYIVKHRPL